MDILDRSHKEEQTDGCGGACRRWGQCSGATQAQSPRRSLWTPCKKSRTDGGGRRWRTLQVPKRYLDQLWERNVEDLWDEWDAQWELYDEGADDMISYRAKLQGKLRPKEAKAQGEKEKRPKYAQGRRVSPGPQMLTAQQRADLDKQVAKTQKDMVKVRARLS